MGRHMHVKAMHKIATQSILQCHVQYADYEHSGQQSISTWGLIPKTGG